jgi:hypothetical protein
LSERFKQTCQYQVVGTLDSLSSTERKHHLRHSDAVSLLSANPYFAGNLAQLKGQ